ncbi:MAG TPA: helix-turn-helix domain-containing protein [Solirubrobacterales bacterium]|nr:helix-turn-helix domain-containing protein [Solirubrobacterales bacterium]
MRAAEARAELAARLRERRGEIEQAILNRTHGVSDPAADRDPLYAEGLRAAVSAAVEFGIEAVGRGESRPPPIPTTLLSQARLAARFGIRLETVLRRYFAGYTLLSDFLIEEAERGGRSGAAPLKGLLRAQAALFDQVIAAVTEEYGREAAARGSTGDRRLILVRKLLNGDLLDAPELGYDLGSNHLGLIAAGSAAGEATRELAAACDCRALVVRVDGETVWGWLGSKRKLDPAGLRDLLESRWPSSCSLAIGELGRGLAGWRLTHRQAQAIFPIASFSSAPIRYGEHALVSAAMENSLLGISLRHLYLEPLTQERDGGLTLRRTLRAYFAAARNGASAANELRVTRQTVSNRLRTIEMYVGRSLTDCAAELEVALRLEEFD